MTNQEYGIKFVSLNNECSCWSLVSVFSSIIGISSDHQLGGKITAQINNKTICVSAILSLEQGKWEEGLRNKNDDCQN